MIPDEFQHRYAIDRREGGERLRDERVHPGGPPEPGRIVEVTIARQRFKARVVSADWPDKTGRRPAEVLLQEC